MDFSSVLKDIILPVISIVGGLAAAILYMSRINAKQDVKLAQITTSMGGMKDTLCRIETNHLAHIETDMKEISKSLIIVKTQFEDHLNQHNK